MAGAAGPQVTVEVVVDGGGASGRGRLTVLRLVWSQDDPLAVLLLLSAQPDHPALPRGRWVVLRDFLRYGLTTRTGDAEVKILPDEARDRVWLELARGGRPCCVSLPRTTVAEFLDATELVVPSGAERSEAAVDELLERLLRR